MTIIKEIFKTLKVVSRNIQLKFRIFTGRLRILPDFLIIGAQKAGTTSLFNYLIKHPDIKSSFSKEVNYFDLNYSKGVNWYRSYFPTRTYKFLVNKFTTRKCITGEGSTYYLLHPHVAKRVHETLPKVKIIVLLRNPVKRTFSGYHHSVNSGSESLSFEEAIEKEDLRIKGELEKIKQHLNYKSRYFPAKAYKTRSIYVNQIENWLKYFSKDQFLIIKSEEFFSDPQKILYQVYKFLNLPNLELKKFNIFMAETKGRKMKEGTLNYLRDFFEPFNQKLYELLERDFKWEDEL